MWIVNWSRLAVFAGVTAAVWFAYKAVYAATDSGNPWPVIALLVFGVVGALVIDRIDRRNKE